ncbi:DNA repair protein RadA [Candidatus Saccharibacteria bacterium]|nr:MAG: DNA repair protein RadA [Candidatus Saccharibacteria bacterium]
MGKKDQRMFACSVCGATSSTWSGKCYECGEWNTLVESMQPPATDDAGQGRPLQPASVAESASQDSPRLATGMRDVDHVLGGGVVPGSVVLLAGQPGIGKSTVLMQLVSAMAAKRSVLYVSGEESIHQVSARAKRLGASGEQLQVASSVVADDIAASIATGAYDAVVVDSIQTISCKGVASAAGSVSQITNSSHKLTVAAKQSNTAVVMVGHVTKEGSIAGPKVLEHLVDVVLQLEGDRYGGFKILRAVKNRYGSTNEAAIFEMTDKGLQIVDNPSAALLEERQVSDGSIVLATLEGSRPILVEVQALVNRTSYGYPKRAASGVDLNRINLLIAMLEKRTKLSLAEQDVYINIVGGIRLQEPAADLAIAMAIASASKGMQLKRDAVVFGELGLSGEVRHVPYAERRIEEAKKLGFSAAIGPVMKKRTSGGYHGVRNVRDALNHFLERD